MIFSRYRQNKDQYNLPIDGVFLFYRQHKRRNLSQKRIGNSILWGELRNSRTSSV